MKIKSFLSIVVGGACLIALPMIPGSCAQADTVPFRQYRTSVTPEAGETLQGRCFYQLLLPFADQPVQAVFVIFDRGWQFGNLYYDPDVVDFAARLHLGLR
jgi:hypothetical protein